MNQLNVFYRICPHPGTKSPILADDKLALTMFCLRSFFRAFEKVNYKITFILDSCPPIYRETIEKLFKNEKTFYEGIRMGDRGSLLKQLELATQLKDDQKVYFAEDDYIYLPDAGKKLVKALDDFDFVTLYDHPDYYQEPHLSQNKTTHISGKHHWVRRISTCNTFGSKSQFLKINKELFIEYAPRDFLMWCEITKDYLLVSPIPSLATHMVAWLMAPGIDWDLEENLSK
jgi:hypothetical protein